MTSHPVHRTLALGPGLLAVLTILGLTLLAGSPGSSRAATSLLRLAVAQQNPDGSIQVHVIAQEAADLAAWEFDLTYDLALLQVVDLQTGPAFQPEEACSPGARCAIILGPRPTPGGSGLGMVTYGDGPGLNGEGVLAVLTLQSLVPEGTVRLGLANALVANTQGQAMTPLTKGVTVELGHTPGHRVFLPAVTNQ